MIVSTLIISTKLYFDKISTGHMYPKLCRGYNTKILWRILSTRDGFSRMKT